MRSIVISGTGLYTPQESISNEELVESFNTYVKTYNREHAGEIESGQTKPLLESSCEFIERASGIKSRFVMNKRGILDPERMCPDIPERANDEPSIQCEISVEAARQALEAANRTSGEIDAVIVACSNLQRPYPAVAVEIQDALDIEGFAFDMNVACSSATFGIQLACDSIANRSADSVLVVNPEICSGHLNFRDIDAHFIFGDVCTAVVVERADLSGSRDRFEILGSKLQTSFSNNIRNNFGFLNRADAKGIGKADKLFVQQGRKVFKEVVPLVANLITAHLEEMDIPTSRLKRMWLHQANLSMNHLISKRVLGREATDEESPTILDEYANTSSAGSIIAYHKYHQDFKPGEIGVICSFGAGYSAGSVIVQKVS
ncbi:MAG: beta-ketoacyl-ACP synthase III [Desulfobacterales bacterium]